VPHAQRHPAERLQGLLPQPLQRVKKVRPIGLNGKGPAGLRLLERLNDLLKARASATFSSLILARTISTFI